MCLVHRQQMLTHRQVKARCRIIQRNKADVKAMNLKSIMVTTFKKMTRRKGKHYFFAQYILNLKLIFGREKPKNWTNFIKIVFINFSKFGL